MAESKSTGSALTPRARAAAVVVLGLAGVAGVVRAWLLPAPFAPTPAAPSAATSPVSADAPPQAREPAPARPPDAPGAAPSVARLINVNTATAAELDLLPGIGPALAAAIIKDREANGPFKSLDDLDRVPRIGPKTIADLVPCATAE